MGAPSTLRLVRCLRPAVLAGWIALVMAACNGLPDYDSVASSRLVAGGSPTTPPHTLTVGDEILIRFQFYSDFNDKVTVGPDGHVSLQLIHDVEVAGLTVPELIGVLNTRYATVLKDPGVSVTVSAFAPQQIYVNGAVGSPGVLRTTVPLTVSRALAQAGGVRLGLAATSNILLLRRHPDGSVYYYQLKVGDRGQPEPDQDPVLQSYDLVYVPETELASVADFVSNVLLRIVPFGTSVSVSHNL